MNEVIFNHSNYQPTFRKFPHFRASLLWTYVGKIYQALNNGENTREEIWEIKYWKVTTTKCDHTLTNENSIYLFLFSKVEVVTHLWWKIENVFMSHTLNAHASLFKCILENFSISVAFYPLHFAKWL